MDREKKRGRKAISLFMLERLNDFSFLIRFDVFYFLRDLYVK